jgi:hypothetical protein
LLVWICQSRPSVGYVNYLIKVQNVMNKEVLYGDTLRA